MDDFLPVDPIVKKAFIVNSDHSIDYIIKYGVHRILIEAIKEPNEPQAQIKRSIVNALSMIAKVSPDMKLNDDRGDNNEAAVARQRRTHHRYFSSRHGGLVEFFICSMTGQYDPKTTIENVTDQTKPSTSDRTKNDIFKSALINTFLSCDPNPVEKQILTGVILTLGFAEDRDGLFMDLFKEHYTLFGKLAEVFGKESIKSLAAENGDFSH